MPFMDLPVRTELSIKNQFIIADSVFFGKRCSIYKVPVWGAEGGPIREKFCKFVNDVLQIREGL